MIGYYEVNSMEKPKTWGDILARQAVDARANGQECPNKEKDSCDACLFRKYGACPYTGTANMFIDYSADDLSRRLSSEEISMIECFKERDRLRAEIANIQRLIKLSEDQGEAHIVSAALCKVEIAQRAAQIGVEV